MNFVHLGISECPFLDGPCVISCYLGLSTHFCILLCCHKHIHFACFPVTVEATFSVLTPAVTSTACHYIYVRYISTFLVDAILLTISMFSLIYSTSLDAFCLAIYCPARLPFFFFLILSFFFFFFFLFSFFFLFLFFSFFLFSFFFPLSSSFRVKVLPSILNQPVFYLLLSTGSRYIQKLYVLQRGVCGAHPSKAFPSTDRRNK